MKRFRSNPVSRKTASHCGTPQQWVERTQITICKTPPAGRETEDCLRPQLWGRDVHEYQVPARCQQFVNMSQR